MLDFPRCSDCLPDQVGSVVLLHSHLSHPADLTSLTSAIKGWLASRSSLTLLLIENMHVKEEATSNDFIVKTEAEEKDIADCVEEMDPYDADGDQLYQVTGNESERSVADDDINSTHVKGKGLLTKKRKRGRPPKKRSTDSDGDDDFDPKKKYKAKIKRVHSPKEVLQVSADVNLNKDVDIKGGVTKLKASKDLGRRVKLLPHLKPRTDDHGVKSWVCDYCGKTKPSLKLLKQHIKLFHWSEAELAAPRRPADKDRTCEFCKTVMHGQYQKYYKHTQECEAKLTGVNKYVCPLCGKDFPACVTYAHHYRKCAGLVPKDQGKTSCCYDGCDYATWGRLNMENHVNRVHLNKPIRHDHMCNTCGKAYNKAKALEQHIREAHLMEKPHECKECGRAFSRKEKLREHSAIHTGELRHQCQLCGKGYFNNLNAYNNNGSLYNHRRSCAVRLATAKGLLEDPAATRGVLPRQPLL